MLKDSLEYLKNHLTEKEIQLILNKLGLSAVELIRKSESIYKENYKGKKLSEDEWIEAMIKFPKLIQRPIIIKDNEAVIGRPLEKVISIFNP